MLRGRSIATPVGDVWRKIFALATMGLWPAAVSPAIPILAVLPGADVSFGVNAANDPASWFGKQIRKIYDEVQASHTSPDNPSVLIVASDADDDFATVAFALAAVAAASETVLLIDADLQHRTLSAIDAEKSDAGLADVAVGRCELADVITRDRDTDISLVPFVSPASRRDRRIDDADVKRAFNQTRCFDLVIVVAIETDNNPSIGFFAGLVDHIVLVGRADDDGGSFAQFISRLRLDARKVCGAVLTGAAAS